MKPDSKILANRIDTMLAFQNGQQVQYRMKRPTSSLWIDEHGAGLIFNFARYSYRIKPVMIEGWVDPSKIHTSLQGGCDTVGCIHVRQIEDES